MGARINKAAYNGALRRDNNLSVCIFLTKALVQDIGSGELENHVIPHVRTSLELHWVSLVPLQIERTETCQRQGLSACDDIVNTVHDGIVSIRNILKGHVVIASNVCEKLILAYDYSTRRNSKYKVIEREDELIDNGSYRYPALTFVRREPKS